VVFCNVTTCICDLKLSLCSECCMRSSGQFPGVWMLYADVSEHCSIFYPFMKMEQSVPKRRNIKFRSRGITQKNAYDLQHVDFGWPRRFQRIPQSKWVELGCVWINTGMCKLQLTLLQNSLQWKWHMIILLNIISFFGGGGEVEGENTGTKKDWLTTTWTVFFKHRYRKVYEQK